MKNKTAIIAIVVLLALLGIGGGYFLFAQKSAPKQDSQIPQQQDQAIPTLSPDAIGLTIALSTVGKNADRKSTRLNSSHQIISYAVFCLKKKNKITNITSRAKRR